jgi:peptide/nickel transport system permease protein
MPWLTRGSGRHKINLLSFPKKGQGDQNMEKKSNQDNQARQETLRRLFWKRFRKNKLALLGGFIVLFLFVVAVFAPWISPYDPGQIEIKRVLEEPGAKHLFGTDSLGRDVLSRMIWGSRISLLVGFVAVGIATLIGIFLGSLAGYYGRWADNLIMRFVDIMLCFPTFFLILAVIALLEPSIWNIMIVIGVTGWMGVARLVRAEFLSLKERDYAVAEKALGAKDFRIIFRHILPNALAPVLVSATLGVAGAILTESALSFLGIGVQPPTPSWGNILTAGKDNIEIAWWLSLYPGLAILITVLGYNLLGEGIRDSIDPRLK